MPHTQVKQGVQDKILIVKSLSITSYIHIIIHKVVHESLISEKSAGEAGWLNTSVLFGHLTGMMLMWKRPAGMLMGMACFRDRAVL